ELGPVTTGRRRRRDGVELSWRASDLRAPRLDGTVPFLIEWGDTPHPSESSPAGATLRSLRVEHPDPDRVAAVLAALGADVPVAGASAPALIATLATPRGPIEIHRIA